MDIQDKAFQREGSPIMNTWRTIKKSSDTGRLDRNAVREAVVALRERRMAAEREPEPPRRARTGRVAEKRAEYGPEK